VGIIGKDDEEVGEVSDEVSDEVEYEAYDQEKLSWEPVGNGYKGDGYKGDDDTFPMRCDFCGSDIMDVQSLHLRRDADGFTWILCDDCNEKWEADGALWQ